MHHISVTVKDVERSLSFYNKHFGFERHMEFKKPDLSGRTLMAKCDNIILEFFQFEGMKENKDKLDDIMVKGMNHIAFSFDDVTKKCEELKKAGLKIKIGPKVGSSGFKYAFIEDPDGIQIELIEINN